MIYQSAANWVLRGDTDGRALEFCWEYSLRSEGALTQRIGTDDLSRVNRATWTMDTWKFIDEQILGWAIKQVAFRRLFGLG